MAEKKKKQRRIKGEHYWTLQNMLKELKKLNKELTEWQQEQAAELEVYPDQINWAIGAIYDPLTEIEDGRVVRGKIISRIPYELLQESKEKTKAIEEQDAAIVEYREEIANKLDTWPNMIDFKTGEINVKEYSPVDPDEEERARKDKTAKADESKQSEDKG